MIEQLENEKRCTGPCAAMLPLSCYYRQSATKDGRQSVCKACKRAAKRVTVVTQIHQPWRPAEEIELVEHMARGLTLAAFAELSGRTLYSVKNRAGLLSRVTRPDAEQIGRTPFQPSAGAHIAWQRIDRRITAQPAANGPTYNMGLAA